MNDKMEEWIEMKIERTRTTISLVLHRPVYDILLHWKNAWELGNSLGMEAFKMPKMPSDLGQDLANADRIRIAKCDSQGIVFYFFEEADRFEWNREAALILAEKICVISEEVAEAFETRRPDCRLFRR